MFKKLKEKIENESQDPLTGDTRPDRDSNPDCTGRSNRVNSLDGYHTDDSMSITSIVNNTNNNSYDNDQGHSGHSEGQFKTDQKLVDQLNDRLYQLTRELLSVQNHNQTLETSLKQLSEDNHRLNQQLTDKSEECRQLRLQLTDSQSIGAEKDDLLLRNAELSSRCQQLLRDLQSERQDRQELVTRYETVRREVDNNTQNDGLVRQLNETVGRLEQSVADKTKQLKLQHQRLHDMKKTFLANQSTSGGKGSAFGGLSVLADEFGNSSGDERSPKHHNSSYLRSPDGRGSDSGGEGGVRPSGLADGAARSGQVLNIEYLRNVVLKYMISNDYEVAAHLVRAISVLLEFTAEEEQLVKQTIAWKMSWIGPLMAAKPTLPVNKK